MSQRLEAHGVALELPTGWDVEFAGVAPTAAQALGGEAFEPLVVHAGNFRLPADRGDFGSGAVEAMGAGGVFVSLLEYEPASAETALFKPNRLPSAIGIDDVAPHTLQRTIAGQAGTQVFCAEAGRAFCLYVVIGSYRRRSTLVPVANEVISTISVS